MRQAPVPVEPTQPTAFLEYDITDQTIAQQPAVIPMIVTSDNGNENFVPVTMELTYQTT